MTVFKFQNLVTDQKTITAVLGTGTGDVFDDSSIDKPVKLGANDNYVKCVAGDEIEGFVSSIEPGTVNAGYSHGGVQTWGRKFVKVDAGQATPLVPGDKVVAGAVVADGTYLTGELPNVQKAAGAITFAWRVISIVTSGAAGGTVLIERAS